MTVEVHLSAKEIRFTVAVNMLNSMTIGQICGDKLSENLLNPDGTLCPLEIKSQYTIGSFINRNEDGRAINESKVNVNMVTNDGRTYILTLGGCCCQKRQNYYHGDTLYTVYR